MRFMGNKVNKKRERMQKQRQRQMHKREKQEARIEKQMLKEESKLEKQLQKRKEKEYKVSMKERQKQYGKREIPWGSLLIAGLLVCLVTLMSFFVFKFDKVSVKGNEQFTEAEIMDYLFKDGKNQNSLFFWFKAKTGIAKVEIPFLENYTVRMKAPNELEFTVDEKSLVGYLNNGGIYVYFDRDGIIVKQTTEKLDGIPKVTGIECDEMILYNEIPAQNKDVFNLLLTVSQAIEKYEFNVKKIHISEDLQVSLFIKKVRINLGKEKDLNEKIIDLNDMINGELLKYEGTLDMTTLSTDGSGYTLKKNSDN